MEFKKDSYTKKETQPFRAESVIEDYSMRGTVVRTGVEPKGFEPLSCSVVLRYSFTGLVHFSK